MNPNYSEKRKDMLGYTEERQVATQEEKELKDKWEIEMGYNTFYWSIPNEDKFYLISIRNIRLCKITSTNKFAHNKNRLSYTFLNSPILSLFRAFVCKSIQFRNKNLCL